MSRSTVKAPGQPSRPFHHQHLDSQIFRANHSPHSQLGPQVPCPPPLLPERGSGFSKEHVFDLRKLKPEAQILQLGLDAQGLSKT